MDGKLEPFETVFTLWTDQTGTNVWLFWDTYCTNQTFLMLNSNDLEKKLARWQVSTKCLSEIETLQVYAFLDVKKSVSDKIETNQSMCSFWKQLSATFFSISFSVWIRMKRCMGYSGNLFPQLKTEMEYCHIVLTKPKDKTLRLWWKYGNYQI